ncbi:MAG: class I SAM-dependent methyltransferase, partial [Geminicoccales bacterium]
TGTTAVFCYLYPGAMARLRPKFESELGPGALVVTNSFPVPGWEPAAVRRADDQFETRVYSYEMR